MELRKYLNCSQAATASVAYTPSQDHEQYRQADKYSLVGTISACSDSGDETISFSKKDDVGLENQHEQSISVDPDHS
ncbi:Kinesin-like protein KIF15 [Corchorus olitorius]|uniref:Kinesin-like protein KIF15 n=1 Tax=Corchorus olitorius TaxID=93759 RepID=A0A1R3J1G3_9ROSI|nr:Kinesin-like protein KIF15 [Corchorus olitorius]